MGEAGDARTTAAFALDNNEPPVAVLLEPSANSDMRRTIVLQYDLFDGDLDLVSTRYLSQQMDIVFQTPRHEGGPASDERSRARRGRHAAPATAAEKRIDFVDAAQELAPARAQERVSDGAGLGCGRQPPFGPGPGGAAKAGEFAPARFRDAALLGCRSHPDHADPVSTSIRQQGCPGFLQAVLCVPPDAYECGMEPAAFEGALRNRMARVDKQPVPPLTTSGCESQQTGRSRVQVQPGETRRLAQSEIRTP
jgi:hypothetical protein